MTMPPEPPSDLQSAVRQAVRETIAGTVRAWIEEITATELNAPDVRAELRPLLAALVKQELQAALAPRSSNAH
ncbi:MAG: hypothetical protein FWD17_11775 [Polyangiaceae bacterium]|nr:hypothetical protein [Polyangiaceae bacterium]